MLLVRSCDTRVRRWDILQCFAAEGPERRETPGASLVDHDQDGGRPGGGGSGTWVSPKRLKLRTYVSPWS